MNSATTQAAAAATSRTAAGLTRLSMALLFVLFGWVALAHAHVPAVAAADIAQACDDGSLCDGIPEAPPPAKLMCGLPAVGDGNEPSPSALPAASGQPLPLPSFDTAAVAIMAAAHLPDGRNSRLFDSRGPPRHA